MTEEQVTAPAAYIPRDATAAITAALAALPVVVLTGMRQTGKTTLLREQPELQGRRYLSLDDFVVLEAARREPEALLAGDEPLTIDEVQRCPQLLSAIKLAVDRDRRPGRFLLSGSANLALLGGVAETLAGRALYLQLHPFTRRELARAGAERPFLHRLFEEPGRRPPASRTRHSLRPDEVLLGGMPPACIAGAEGARLWFAGFEQTYIERDVRSLSQVADLVTFRRVLQLAALRSGQVLNTSEIGRDARLNATTTARYLGVLETSFLMTRLAPFLRNRASRVIKSPKLFLSDAGLAGHLAGVETLEAAAEEPLRGALYETYVHQNLAAVVGAHWPRARLAYWHVQGRHEVDFVIEAGRDCLALEVKAASRWGERDLAGLRAFLAATPRCRAAILGYNGAEVVALGERLWAVPLGLALS
jgi:predicted AAA+ superfamily ATPase